MIKHGSMVLSERVHAAMLLKAFYVKKDDLFSVLCYYFPFCFLRNSFHSVRNYACLYRPEMHLTKILLLCKIQCKLVLSCSVSSS